jgi:hypothetical protein
MLEQFWIVIKFTRNSISTRVQIVVKEWMHPCFLFACLLLRRLTHHHIITGSILCSDIAEEKCMKLVGKHTHLR